MFDDVNKSVKAVLYERTTSPFFGTLILSWLVWNWKIVYLTFFISEENLSINKVDFIQLNYCDEQYLILYPALSTILLLTIIPFASNGSFWLSLQFNQWKKAQKNIIEKKQLLTLEQSIELRQELMDEESKFEKLLAKKDLEIKQLKQIIDEQSPGLREETRIKETLSDATREMEKLREMAIEFKVEPQKLEAYNSIIRKINEGDRLISLSVNEIEMVSKLTSFDLIKNLGNARYSVTDIGREFMKQMMSNK